MAATITNEQAAALTALHARMKLRAADPQVQSILSDLGQYLLECEDQLIALMNNTPPPATGNIEFGPVLYWIHHDLPDDAFFNWIASLFPQSQISTATWQQWEVIWAGPGVVASDGTLADESAFGALCKGWVYPSLLYILLAFGEVTLAKFSTTPPPQINITGKPSLTIAMISDWGTGAWSDVNTQGPAPAIMQQIQSLNPTPDILIHLGDVYYSGTGNLSLEVVLAMAALGVEVGVDFDAQEETDRLTNAWWPANAPLSFTLNSNHEMYSGANGFLQAITNAPFAKQAGHNYFAINYGNWLILALDSAYYSDSLLFMEGRLQNSSSSAQVEWLKTLSLQGKSIIALTHHTGLSLDGQPQTAETGSATLYQDLSGALGRDPDYWYWGHIHNGAVYTDKVSLSPTTKTSTLCRCLGHAALPFGNAYYWLDGVKYNINEGPNAPNIAYYAHTPLQPQNPPLQWQNRVKNGFAVLTLTPDTITEAFYEQGNKTPVWTSGTTTPRPK